MKAKVTNISGHVFRLLLGNDEKFLSFEDFSWFCDASGREISAVELQSVDHLYWPLLDIDLATESLDHPERFPLISSVPVRAS